MQSVFINKKGFTFIEIIMVMLLVSFISLAIYTNFSSGLRIWQRIKRSALNEDLNIFLEKLKRDLKNCFLFKGIDFMGKEDSVSFAVLVNSPNLKAKTPGKVIYLYDSNNKVLKRMEWDYSGIYNQAQTLRELVIKNITQANFKYNFFDKAKKQYLWSSEWNEKEKLPLAVELELEVTTDSEVFKYNQTISIPIGG